MHRRHFVQTTAAAASLPLVIGRMPAQAHATTPELAAVTGAAQPSDRVLVLVYLQGGNDGLNTIIPRDKYSELMKLRANVMIPERKVLALTDEAGLHPAMSGVHNLYREGKLGIVQGVHSAVPDGSHFQATNIMFSGLDSDQLFRTGWLGRYLDAEYPGYPQDYPNANMPDPLAITLGGMASNLCQATVNTSISVRDLDSLRQLADGPSGPLPATPMGREVGYLRQVVDSLNAYSSTIKTATTKARNLSAKYPSGNFLAEQLKIVAQLVGGGLRTRVYVCHAYGFDTHANQVDGYDTASGSHARLLGQLSDALAGFQDDLRLLGIEDRVVGMTVSEFGRRIKSSSSLGTDHGEAAPVMLFGTNINPQIHGESPDVAGSSTGSVPMQYDFRTLYTSILQDWFRVAPATLEALFPSQNTPGGFPYLPVIRQSTPPPPPVSLTDGDGLRGAYYNGMNFEALHLTRTDPTVNFDWRLAAPAPGISPNQFSVRWTGQLLPRYSEEYTFYLRADDGHRLWVDGQLIVDSWADAWPSVPKGPARAQLTAGQKVAIRLEYYENGGLANARLEWASASQRREVVPQSQLFSAAAGTEAAVMAEVATRKAATPQHLTGQESAGLSVYPNPVRDAATLTFEGRGPGQVMLCDLAGRVVRVLAKGDMQGPQTVRLSAANLPAGSYFCRIEEGRRVRTVRVQVSR